MDNLDKQIDTFVRSYLARLEADIIKVEKEMESAIDRRLALSKEQAWFQSSPLYLEWSKRNGVEQSSGSDD